MDQDPFICNKCEEAFHPHLGIKGDDADVTKFMFVLHRSDSRALQPTLLKDDWELALRESQTGRTLYRILKFCGYDLRDVYITNFFKCLLPDDREPRKGEYQNCTSILEDQIEFFQPRKVVLFGATPYNHLFPERSKEVSYKIAVRRVALDHNDAEVLISPHPGMIWKMNDKDTQRNYKRICKFLERRI